MGRWGLPRPGALSQPVLEQAWQPSAAAGDGAHISWSSSHSLPPSLADLGRDLPVSQVPLQALSQAETLQLVQAITNKGAGTRRSGGERDPSPTQPSTAETSPAQESETNLFELGDFLFAQTDGQPLYLLETFKLFRTGSGWSHG